MRRKRDPWRRKSGEKRISSVETREMDSILNCFWKLPRREEGNSKHAMSHWPRQPKQQPPMLDQRMVSSVEGEERGGRWGISDREKILEEDPERRLIIA